MIGELTSNGAYSSYKNTGSPVTSIFSTTTVNQELVLFEKEGSVEGNRNLLNCNAVTIIADAADLCFSVCSNRKIAETHSYVGDPVFICKSGQSVSLNGLNICAIKFENNSGAKYSIQAFSW